MRKKRRYGYQGRRENAFACSHYRRPKAGKPEDTVSHREAGHCVEFGKVRHVDRKTLEVYSMTFGDTVILTYDDRSHPAKPVIKDGKVGLEALSKGEAAPRLRDGDIVAFCACHLLHEGPRVYAWCLRTSYDEAVLRLQAQKPASSEGSPVAAGDAVVVDLEFAKRNGLGSTPRTGTGRPAVRLRYLTPPKVAA